jgi:hypothetical protein
MFKYGWRPFAAIGFMIAAVAGDFISRMLSISFDLICMAGLVWVLMPVLFKDEPNK